MIAREIALLFVLPLPIACIAWTITHEEVFRELHDWCAEKSRTSRHLLTRKFYYLFTCEYCFSHYVAAFFLLITRYQLLFPDWRGTLIAGFSLVWVANLYMSFFARLRLEIQENRLDIAVVESQVLPKAGDASAPALVPPHADNVAPAARRSR